jgi:hypothetical protein
MARKVRPPGRLQPVSPAKVKAIISTFNRDDAGEAEVEEFFTALMAALGKAKNGTVDQPALEVLTASAFAFLLWSKRYADISTARSKTSQAAADTTWRVLARETILPTMKTPGWATLSRVQRANRLSDALRRRGIDVSVSTVRRSSLTL